MFIQIENLSKTYPAGGDIPPTFALRNVDLSIRRGEIFGIIGMSGAGKSTFMRCLTKLEEPTEGRVIIAGDEISALTGRPLSRARRKIGMIFQHFHLFSSRTALQNVLYPMEIEGRGDQKKAYALLRQVGLEGRAHSYPAALSGGEKQRVAIARALASDPACLFCDEATSALDPQTTRSILGLLSDLNRDLGLTIVLITHEMEVVKQICNRVAVLEHGQIVEQGGVADLFAAPKHPTTKRFLQTMPHELPAHFVGKRLLRLGFKGTAAEKPIISQVVKNYDVNVNVLLGGIDHLQDMTIGSLVVELTGSDEEVARARLFLEKEGVVCDNV